MADGFGSYINVAFKLAEFCLRLQAAPEETVVFGRLIDRVRLDRAEALRERKLKATTLEDLPEKRAWIDKTIQDTTDALQTIGKLVESARIDVAKGKRVSLQHRFEWVLSKKDDFLAKQSLLATCHQSLAMVIVFMQTLREGTVNEQQSVAPPSYADDEAASLRAPIARRPKPKQSYSLPAWLHQASALSDDWEQSFGAEHWSAQKDLDHSGSAASKLYSSTSDPWDDVSADDAARAAANAIDSLGGNSKNAAAIADSLRRSVTSDERRRRRQAYFDCEDGVEDPRDEDLEQLLQQSTDARRRRFAAHFDSS